jgi:hypothetical protein
MELERYTDAAAFEQAVLPYLIKQEAENCLPGG